MSYSSGNKYGLVRGGSYGGDSSRGFNRGFRTPKPVEAGKEYDAANHRKAPSRILARLIEVKYGNVIAAPPVLRY